MLIKVHQHIRLWDISTGGTQLLQVTVGKMARTLGMESKNPEGEVVNLRRAHQLLMWNYYWEGVALMSLTNSARKGEARRNGCLTTAAVLLLSPLV